MKLWKRVSCAAMALAMTLALCVGAHAATATPSTQKLELNGGPVSVTPYNIGGSNYFKLRDVAYFLSGTHSQFSVGYDRAANAVTIVTGGVYSKVGGELAAVGSGAKNAVLSTQTIYINGKKNTSLIAYNIDGNNYFKLRDLGTALGSDVDYDEARRTMLINTPNASNADICFTTVDMDGNEWTEACFGDHELTVINLWAYWCGPCVRELPDLQKLADDYASRGVQMLGISYEEYEEDNIAMLKQLGVTYPCLRYTGEFDEYMDTGYFPTTIFVNKFGKVLDDPVIGSQSYSAWASLIDGYIR